MNNNEAIRIIKTFEDLKERIDNPENLSIINREIERIRKSMLIIIDIDKIKF
jgi:hypothetical protein